MDTQNYNDVFASNLKKYMEQYSISQVELAKKLGVCTASVHYWLTGIKTPRMDKVDALCDIFHCQRSDLMLTDNTYYLDDETTRIAQEVYESPELRMVFDATRNMKPEDIKRVAQMIELFKDGNK